MPTLYPFVSLCVPHINYTTPKWRVSSHNEDFNLDALIHSALEKVQKRYQSDNLIENDDFEAIIRERLPEDTGYQMSNLIGSQEKFNFRATSTDITTESLDGWLVEFQTINDVFLKLKTTKKP